MADTMSVRDRIASLNLNHVGHTPQTQRPSILPRAASTGVCHIDHEDGQNGAATGNQPIGPEPANPASVRAEPRKPPPPPSLPPRRTSQAPTVRPVLPPRNPSQASVSPGGTVGGPTLKRRDSLESVSSTQSSYSTISALSGVTSNTHSTTSRRPSFDTRSTVSSPRHIPAYDPASLPPLPPKRAEPKRRSLASPAPSISSNDNTQQGQLAVQPNPTVLRRVSTPTTSNTAVVPTTNSQSHTAPRQTPQPRSALSFALNKPMDPAPPVPVASRPKLPNGQITTSKYERHAASMKAACMVCRDFSGPDEHAAQFPRETLPSRDTAWLAQQLTCPFQSDTDKARVIFTWLHHNIAYNCEAFFTGKRQPGDPATTLATGVAVCEGYAGLFSALCLQAGLECVVVGGHGKGYGHNPVQPGEPVPPYAPDGHAWNAVKIDGGQWKLVEPCWGAGHIDGDRKYVKSFTPDHFTTGNDEFGLRHFPRDPNYFFRSDGKPMTWERYMLGESGPGEDVTIYSGCESEHGISRTGFLPKKKHIQVRGANPKGRVQFQFQRVCEHWTSEKMGKGKEYLYVLAVGGKEGRKREEIPFLTNGQFSWLDVLIEDLGTAGQTVSLYYVSTLDGKDGRGVTAEEFKRAKRSYKGFGYGGVAAWQLV